MKIFVLQQRLTVHDMLRGLCALISQTLHPRLVFLGLLVLFLTPVATVLPQDNQLPPGAPSPSLPELVLNGWLNVIYGDPQAGSGQPARQVILLNDQQGSTLAEMVMNTELAQDYFGREVEVTGRIISTSPYDRKAPRLALEALKPVQSALKITASSVMGSQPWVNILCKFSDVPTVPRQPADYQPLFSSTYPGLDHYWRQTSYNNINLLGTTTAAQWVTLPLPRSAYITASGNADLSKLSTDCTNAANPLVNFPAFVGINMMFNDVLDCCAWGGSSTLNLDGTIQSYRITWLPPWSQVYSTIAHEMGHGFGFSHSTGPADDPPSDLNVYVSDWDVMSSSDGTCLVGEAQPPNGFGCFAVGTIAYNLDSAGWIPANRRITVNPGETKTVTLEQLQLPVSTTNLLLARVPIGGSLRHFYTVETHFGTGYDQNSPAAAVNGAVLIHDIDTVNHVGNGGMAYVVDALENLSPAGCVSTYALPLPFGCNDLNDDVNDAGGRWTAGETFADVGNNIGIQVVSKGSSSFTVQIVNHSPPQLFPDEPSDLVVLGTAVNSVTLGWEDNSFNETGFKIYKWQYCNGILTFCFHTSVSANTTTFTDQDLPCDNTFYYQVTSYNQNAESTPTAYITVKTDPCSPGNVAPAINYFANGQITLTWTPVTWAVDYQVQVGTDALFIQPLIAQPDIKGDSVSLTLGKGTYYWRVRAQNSAGGFSPWSTVQTVTVGM